MSTFSSLREAARYAGVSYLTIREWARSYGIGELVDGRWRINQEKLDAYLEDYGALANALANTPNGSGKPVAFIAHTVKGKGVSFMEDDNNWHYRIPTAEEVQKAADELGITR